VRRAALPGTLAAALLAGCTGGGYALPEVRVYASVSPLGAQALSTLATNRRLARVVYVAEPQLADLAWFGDPTQALEAAPLLVRGSAPPQPDVEARYGDPEGRFFPLCARARVLLANPRAGLVFMPGSLSELTSPRLAGSVALVPFGRGEGPLTVAALSLLHGEEATLGFLAALGRGRPQLSRSDGEARAAVASGIAALGLVGSEEAAAGAASAAALEPIYPDQAGVGTLVFPTAVAVLARGKTSPGARQLAEWMASRDAETLVAARAPGYLPLRRSVPIPPGVRSAGDLRSPRFDWNRLAAEKNLLAPRLESWPRPPG